jgi:hypothetical protein
MNEYDLSMRISSHRSYRRKASYSAHLYITIVGYRYLSPLIPSVLYRFWYRYTVVSDMQFLALILPQNIDRRGVSNETCVLVCGVEGLVS